MEYLGLWVTHEGISSTEKIEAIVFMAPPRNRNEAHRLFGIINYCGPEGHTHPNH